MTQLIWFRRALQPAVVLVGFLAWSPSSTAQPVNVTDRCAFALEAWDLIKACTLVITQIGDESWAYNNRGSGYRKLGDLQGALANYTIAIKLDPENALAFANRAATQIEMGYVDAGLADYDAAILLDDDNAAIRNDRGVALATAGRFEEAIIGFGEALEIDDSYVEALNNRGNALLSLGDVTNAITDFRSGLAIAPGDPYLLNSLAWALYLDGNLVEAHGLVLQAADLLPEAFVFDTLGHVLAGQGDIDGAVIAFEEAMAHGGSAQVAIYEAELVAQGYLPDSAIGEGYSEELQQAMTACLIDRCRLAQ